MIVNRRYSFECIVMLYRTTLSFELNYPIKNLMLNFVKNSNK